MSDPELLQDYIQRGAQAAKAYADANPGPGPASEAALLPYFNPPFDSVTTGRLLKAWREQKQ